jgi:hypothetical protein
MHTNARVAQFELSGVAPAELDAIGTMVARPCKPQEAKYHGKAEGKSWNEWTKVARPDGADEVK